MRHLGLILFGHTSHFGQRVEFHAKTCHHLLALGKQHLFITADWVLFYLWFILLHRASLPAQLLTKLRTCRSTPFLDSGALDFSQEKVSEFPRSNKTQYGDI